MFTENTQQHQNLCALPTVKKRKEWKETVCPRRETVRKAANCWGTDGWMDAQNIQVRKFFLARFQTFKMFLLMIIVSDFASLLPWFFYKQVHWKSSSVLSSHNSPNGGRSPTWGRGSGLVFSYSSTMKTSWEGSRPRQLCCDLLSELATIEIRIFWAESVAGFCWCFAFTAREVRFVICLHFHLQMCFPRLNHHRAVSARFI